MTHWEEIWTFKTKRFKVAYSVAPDDDLDLSFDDDGSVREGIESGKYIAFVARMTVSLDGHELGTDYLGGCIYESAEAFIDHRGIKSQPNVGSYFSDMVRGAIADTRKDAARICSVKLRAVAS